nr:neuromedin-U isoform X1 [Macaca fascicularis]
MLRTASCPPRSPPGQGAAASTLLLLLLLACCAGACRGAPISPQGLQPAQQLQLWNEIDDACSSFLSIDSQPQASNALEELCFVIMGMLPKPQEQDEKDNTKRFLFHYSKTQKLGNSNVVSSVVHPLLQLVPHLHERRMKRFRVDLKLWTLRKVGTTLFSKSHDSLGRIPKSLCKSKSRIFFIQATEWKKVSRVHLKWLPTNFPQSNAMEYKMY